MGDFSDAAAVRIAAEQGRDKNRTPNQWACAANAGFSPAGVSPWLPVNPDYAQGVNYADQAQDPASLLNFYRNLLAVRRQNPALIYGDYQPLDDEAEATLAYLRTSPEQRCLVLMNMTDWSCQVKLDLPVKHSRLVFSTHPRTDRAPSLQALELAPFEAMIVELVE